MLVQRVESLRVYTPREGSEDFPGAPDADHERRLSAELPDADHELIPFEPESEGGSSVIDEVIDEGVEKVLMENGEVEVVSEEEAAKAPPPKPPPPDPQPSAALTEKEMELLGLEWSSYRPEESARRMSAWMLDVQAVQRNGAEIGAQVYEIGKELEHQASKVAGRKKLDGPMWPDAKKWVKDLDMTSEEICERDFISVKQMSSASLDAEVKKLHKWNENMATKISDFATVVMTAEAPVDENEAKLLKEKLQLVESKRRSVETRVEEAALELISQEHNKHEKLVEKVKSVVAPFYEKMDDVAGVSKQALRAALAARRRSSDHTPSGAQRPEKKVAPQGRLGAGRPQTPSQEDIEAIAIENTIENSSFGESLASPVQRSEALSGSGTGLSVSRGGKVAKSSRWGRGGTVDGQGAPMDSGSHAGSDRRSAEGFLNPSLKQQGAFDKVGDVWTEVNDLQDHLTFVQQALQAQPLPPLEIEVRSGRPAAQLVKEAQARLQAERVQNYKTEQYMADVELQSRARVLGLGGFMGNRLGNPPTRRRLKHASSSHRHLAVDPPGGVAEDLGQPDIVELALQGQPMKRLEKGSKRQVGAEDAREGVGLAEETTGSAAPPQLGPHSSAAMAPTRPAQPEPPVHSLVLPSKILRTAEVRSTPSPGPPELYPCHTHSIILPEDDAIKAKRPVPAQPSLQHAHLTQPSPRARKGPLGVKGSSQGAHLVGLQLDSAVLPDAEEVQGFVGHSMHSAAAAPDEARPEPPTLPRLSLEGHHFHGPSDVSEPSRRPLGDVEENEPFVEMVPPVQMIDHQCRLVDEAILMVTEAIGKQVQADWAAQAGMTPRCGNTFEMKAQRKVLMDLLAELRAGEEELRSLRSLHVGGEERWVASHKGKGLPRPSPSLAAERFYSNSASQPSASPLPPSMQADKGPADHTASQTNTRDGTSTHENVRGLIQSVRDVRRKLIRSFHQYQNLEEKEAALASSSNGETVHNGPSAHVSPRLARFLAGVDEEPFAPGGKPGIVVGGVAINPRPPEHGKENASNRRKVHAQSKEKEESEDTSFEAQKWATNSGMKGSVRRANPTYAR
ncbi:hypothetical protein CYMTET_23156 [Cymbomonas tetramitiformis]|uniref:Uncharacterized protein n=1 Tax=Cymbomonas tetramitiformis TaxID=36881 RepID=A0AAE0FYU8_9CHLO|nr:hypothetical protein CYMTET_23156 [Cymbomonas tetramitiformis]